MFVSYAQNFEDVILWRALKHVKRGFYIDVGAQDPVVDSVSLAFYEHGWRGVHIEPNSHYAEKLRQARPDEEVIEAAIGSTRESITLYEVADTGLSTGVLALATKYETEGRLIRAKETHCLPLSEIFDRYKARDIHWLKIDVEGMENQLIEGWGPSFVTRPWIVVIESTFPLSPEPCFADWDPRLVALGYEFVYFDGLNRFYVSREHLELITRFGPGPNVFDDFALSGLSNASFCKRVNTEAADLRQRLAQDQRELAQQHERGQWLEREWKAAEGRLDELTQQLRAVYASRSWRVTTSLRAATQLTRRLCAGVRPVGRNIAKGANAFVPPMLRRVIRFALGRSAFKRRAPASAPPSGNVSPLKQSRMPLTPRARQIYTDLNS